MEADRDQDRAGIGLVRQVLLGPRQSIVGGVGECAQCVRPAPVSSGGGSPPEPISGSKCESSPPDPLSVPERGNAGPEVVKPAVGHTPETYAKEARWGRCDLPGLAAPPL